MKQVSSNIRCFLSAIIFIAHFISRLSSETHQHRAPQLYREILYELSLNTPVCGMIQIAGKSEAIEVIRLIASGDDIGKPIPSDVSNLLNHLCELLLAPFEDTTSQPFPKPPADKKTLFFPSLPIVRGTSVYTADHLNSSKIPDDVDSCRNV